MLDEGALTQEQYEQVLDSPIGRPYYARLDGKPIDPNHYPAGHMTLDDIKAAGNQGLQVLAQVLDGLPAGQITHEGQAVTRDDGLAGYTIPHSVQVYNTDTTVVIQTPEGPVKMHVDVQGSTDNDDRIKRVVTFEYPDGRTVTQTVRRSYIDGFGNSHRPTADPLPKMQEHPGPRPEGDDPAALGEWAKQTADYNQYIRQTRGRVNYFHAQGAFDFLDTQVMQEIHDKLGNERLREYGYTLQTRPDGTPVFVPNPSRGGVTRMVVGSISLTPEDVLKLSPRAVEHLLGFEQRDARARGADVAFNRANPTDTTRFQREVDAKHQQMLAQTQQQATQSHTRAQQSSGQELLSFAEWNAANPAGAGAGPQALARYQEYLKGATGPPLAPPPAPEPSQPPPGAPEGPGNAPPSDSRGIPAEGPAAGTDLGSEAMSSIRLDDRPVSASEFASHTGQQSTGDPNRDVALWEQASQRKLGEFNAWQAEGERLVQQLQEERSSRLADLDTQNLSPSDARSRGLGSADLTQDARYQQWLDSQPSHFDEESQVHANITGAVAALQTGERDYLDKVTTALTVQGERQALLRQLQRESRNRQEGVDALNLGAGELQARGTGDVDVSHDSRVQALVERMRDAGYSEDDIQATLEQARGSRGAEQGFLGDVSAVATADGDRRRLLRDLRQESRARADASSGDHYDVEGEGDAGARATAVDLNSDPRVAALTQQMRDAGYDQAAIDATMQDVANIETESRHAPAVRQSEQDALETQVVALDAEGDRQDRPTRRREPSQPAVPSEYQQVIQVEDDLLEHHDQVTELTSLGWQRSPQEVKARQDALADAGVSLHEAQVEHARPPSLHLSAEEQAKLIQRKQARMDAATQVYQDAESDFQDAIGLTGRQARITSAQARVEELKARIPLDQGGGIARRRWIEQNPQHMAELAGAERELGQAQGDLDRWKTANRLEDPQGPSLARRALGFVPVVSTALAIGDATAPDSAGGRAITPAERSGLRQTFAIDALGIATLPFGGGVVGQVGRVGAKGVGAGGRGARALYDNARNLDFYPAYTGTAHVGQGLPDEVLKTLPAQSHRQLTGEAAEAAVRRGGPLFQRLPDGSVRRGGQNLLHGFKEEGLEETGEAGYEYIITGDISPVEVGGQVAAFGPLDALDQRRGGPRSITPRNPGLMASIGQRAGSLREGLAGYTNPANRPYLRGPEGGDLRANPYFVPPDPFGQYPHAPAAGLPTREGTGGAERPDVAGYGYHELFGGIQGERLRLDFDPVTGRLRDAPEGYHTLGLDPAGGTYRPYTSFILDKPLGQRPSGLYAAEGPTPTPSGSGLATDTGATTLADADAFPSRVAAPVGEASAAPRVTPRTAPRPSVSPSISPVAPMPALPGLASLTVVAPYQPRIALAGREPHVAQDAANASAALQGQQGWTVTPQPERTITVYPAPAPWHPSPVRQADPVPPHTPSLTPVTPGPSRTPSPSPASPVITPSPVTTPQTVTTPAHSPQVAAAPPAITQPVTTPSPVTTPVVTPVTTPTTSVTPELTLEQVTTTEVSPTVAAVTAQTETSTRRSTSLTPEGDRDPDEQDQEDEPTDPSGRLHPRTVQFETTRRHYHDPATGGHVAEPEGTENLDTLRVVDRSPRVTEGEKVVAANLEISVQDGNVVPEVLPQRVIRPGAPGVTPSPREQHQQETTRERHTVDFVADTHTVEPLGSQTARLTRPGEVQRSIEEARTDFDDAMTRAEDAAEAGDAPAQAQAEHDVAEAMARESRLARIGAIAQRAIARGGAAKTAVRGAVATGLEGGAAAAMQYEAARQQGRAQQVQREAAREQARKEAQQAREEWLALPAAERLARTLNRRAEGVRDKSKEELPEAQGAEQPAEKGSWQEQFGRFMGQRQQAKQSEAAAAKKAGGKTSGGQGKKAPTLAQLARQAISGAGSGGYGPPAGAGKPKRRASGKKPSPRRSADPQVPVVNFYYTGPAPAQAAPTQPKARRVARNPYDPFEGF